MFPNRKIIKVLVNDSRFYITSPKLNKLIIPVLKGISNMKKFLFESGATIGYIVGIIGAIVTICLVPGSINIENKWLVIGLVPFISLIVITIKAIIELKKVSTNGTRYSVVSYSNSNSEHWFYTKYSENLRMNTLVCLYKKSPMSKKVAIGIVTNTSISEYVEVKILFPEIGMENTFSECTQNNSTVLDDLYILPNVYISSISSIYSFVKNNKANKGDDD